MWNSTRFAGLISAPSRYPWSSAAAHVRGRDDALVRVAPLLQLAPDWRRFLTRVIREEDLKLLAPTSIPAGHWVTRPSSPLWNRTWVGS